MSTDRLREDVHIWPNGRGESPRPAAAIVIALALLVLGSCGDASRAQSAASPSIPVASSAPTRRAVSPSVPVATSAPITQGLLQVKTAGTVVALDGDRVWLRIVDRNTGAQAVWNGMTVAAVVTTRTVFPGLGVTRLADARLPVGAEVTFTFIPAEYDERLGAYPALVIGREQIR